MTGVEYAEDVHIAYITYISVEGYIYSVYIMHYLPIIVLKKLLNIHSQTCSKWEGSDSMKLHAALV
jgi:hypothetical protein